MKKRIRNEGYLTIQGWMYNLGCSNINEIMAYALVYGFSQDDNSQFRGSISYIQEWLLCSKNTAITTMRNLEVKGLIKKEQEVISGVTFNRYTAVVPDFERGVQNLNRGSSIFEPNIYNNNYSIEKENVKRKSDFDLSFVDIEFLPAVEEWLAYKKERKEKKYTERGLKAFYKNLLAYSNFDPLTAQKIIEQSIANNYMGIFPLKQNNNGNSNNSKYATPTQIATAVATGLSGVVI